MLSYDWLFVTLWNPLSFIVSFSLLELMSIELVMLYHHLILCYPFLLLPSSFPASESFPMSQLFASGGQSTAISASASVLPMNSQDWFALGLTGLFSLHSKGLSRNLQCHNLKVSLLYAIYSSTYYYIIYSYCKLEIWTRITFCWYYS